MHKKERPILSNLIRENTLGTEKIQNEVLRPIIKMQHKILISYFKNYAKTRKIDFDKISEDKKKPTIKNLITKDNSLKKVLIGIIVGHFSLEELGIYYQNTSEYNKRIHQIITNRIIDSLEEL